MGKSEYEQASSPERFGTPEPVQGSLAGPPRCRQSTSRSQLPVWAALLLGAIRSPTPLFAGSKHTQGPACPSHLVQIPKAGAHVPPMNRVVPEAFLAGGEPVPQGRTRRCLSAVESRDQLEEEEEDEEEGRERKEMNSSHAVPLRRSGAFRAHSHTYDPFKRHSWGSGREHQDPMTRFGGDLIICGVKLGVWYAETGVL
ncbi:hypothetical protein TREES_T100016124 [Tupaia chinensis]|uniref:Uncharacterized protein n=1 Tax=Tupaia chinensis TaxID=246437 RepID=L9KAW9_TUPCH|nr:hypothetical protein TREES_T100016124 [Tupaia chinensis]